MSNVSFIDGHIDRKMTPQEALNRLAETVIGDLELKVVLSKALEKQMPKKPMTQFDCIKAMSIDEIADYINANYKCRKCVYYNKNCCNGDCHNGIKKWLESEVEEE